MCTYLKNMAGFTHNQLKNKSFDEVQKAFDKTMSWIDSFVPMDSEVVKGSKDRAEGSETRAEGSSKRAGEDLQQESTKKQKMDDDKEKEELKQCFEIVLDDGDDVTIDATPLSVKIPIAMYLNDVFGSILLVKIKLLIKKLEDSADEHQVYGRIVGIIRLLSAVEVIAAGYDYYCW
ncbi:hypothetical protein Tco_0162662 [Tanacetum coccineum]